MTISHHELSFDTVIPSAILVNDNIELAAVKLFAFIKGLTKLHGYCFATNEYLATLMKATSRSVQRWIIQLKKEGYLEIETEKNGIHWQRRLYISDKFKKSLRREMGVTPPRHTCHPPTTYVSPITKDYSNKDYSKGEEAEPPPPPPLFQVHKRVKMESQKYNALVTEFGEVKIREMMERLDEYADINPKRFKQYGCHATVIRKWLRDDAEKSPGGPTRPSKETTHQLAQKVAQKYPGIEALPTGILFLNRGAGQDLHIDYKEHGFRDQVLNRLRKMGLSVEGL